MLGERKEERDGEDDLTRKGRFWPRRAIRRPLINWPCMARRQSTFFFEKGIQALCEQVTKRHSTGEVNGVTEGLAWGRRGGLVSITYN
jgi:hypothetical protein